MVFSGYGSNKEFMYDISFIKYSRVLNVINSEEKKFFFSVIKIAKFKRCRDMIFKQNKNE